MRLVLLLSIVLLTGCATKGGWPCWAWQKNTDQKLEKDAEKTLNKMHDESITNTVKINK